MPLYEHVFLARQDISAQQVEALLQSFRGLLEGFEDGEARIEVALLPLLRGEVVVN